MRRGCLAILLTASCLLTPGRSYPDTILDIAGVEKSVGDAKRAAIEAGDAISEQFADQALRVIAAWKQANADLVDKAFSDLDQQTQSMFRHMDDIAEKIRNQETVTFLDMQLSIASAGDVLASAPGVSKDPQVSFYYPATALPTGLPALTVYVIGTRISNGSPAVTYMGKNIKVEMKNDNELQFDIQRSDLQPDQHVPKNRVLDLKYLVSDSVWYNPFSWGSSETRHRDIVLNVLPLVPGSISEAPTVSNNYVETMVDGPILVGGRGKDNDDRYAYVIKPLWQRDGWVLDLPAQTKDIRHFDDNFGDGDGGSYCIGYDQNSFGATSLLFVIHHGHRGRVFKSDAHQNCRIWVHLTRTIPKTEPGKVLSKTLDWQKDVSLSIPDNAITAPVTFSLFTGRSYIIENDGQIPYGIFQIFRSKDEIKFRPRESELSDF